jgi:hypothetical protein
VPGSWRAIASYAPVDTVSAASPQNSTTLTSCSQCGPRPGRKGARRRSYSSRPFRAATSRLHTIRSGKPSTKTAIGMKLWPRAPYHVATETRMVSETMPNPRRSCNRADTGADVRGGSSHDDSLARDPTAEAVIASQSGSRLVSNSRSVGYPRHTVFWHPPANTDRPRPGHRDAWCPSAARSWGSGKPRVSTRSARTKLSFSSTRREGLFQAWTVAYSRSRSVAAAAATRLHHLVA